MTQFPLPVVRDPKALSDALFPLRAAGRRIGFVPTMGGLHQGHLSLLEIARANADVTVASLFVNPTQFAPTEDFAAYPRREGEDAALLANAGCDLLYAPTPAAMYPQGFVSKVLLEGPAKGLESEARPHFFGGVATVVLKLLNQVRPHVAVFGEKDYQQLMVIRRMVADLDVGVEILPGPTLREPDGLAMSTRNQYLTPEARLIAGRLNRTLFDIAEDLAGGGAWRNAEIHGAKALTAAGFTSVDYVAVRDAETLASLKGDAIDRPARVLAAARIGGVRLIDNVAAELR